MLAITLCITSAALLSPTQEGAFGESWLGFDRDDSRIIAGNNVGLGDGQERNYAAGDLDRDGWTDLVVVRKQPLDVVGPRRNVLLMNEAGVLVDRTDVYASASDVPGDSGFLTRTNDRDVVLVDVDQDGWLDVVTATTLSPNEPKEVSHPRVYMNLGEDTSGWLGLRYEAARFPQLLLSDGTPSWPRFTAVAAGDVTGDGYPDLYFGDNDSSPGSGGGDMNERLLVNDGTGSFVDETVQRMGGSQLGAIYTTSVVIRDLNGDGLNDILRNRGYFGQVRISYNDPGDVGVFSLQDTIQQTAPYFTTVGDLNRDDRLDLVTAENVADSHRFNTGNSPSGAVDWGPRRTFDFLAGSDDGFGGDSYIHDFDLDGWPDVLICDFDIELPGCDRYTHLYHNLGGSPGSTITLREERESLDSGWRGAEGWFTSDLQGVHDAGLLDLDRDGDTDIVLATCSDTKVYLNTTIDGEAIGLPFCGCDTAAAPCGNQAMDDTGCLNSSSTGARLRAHGSTSVTSDNLSFSAFGAIPGQFGLLFTGTGIPGGGQGIPFGDGILCTGGDVIRLELQPTSPVGFSSFGPGLAAAGGWRAGDTRFFQLWYRDPVGGPCGSGFNVSNAIQLSFSQ